jgi:hypothetical protein
VIAAAQGQKRMAGRKKENFRRGRAEFNAEPALLERATAEGARLGLNLSAFIRMVLVQYLDRADAEREARRQGKTT